MPSERVGRIIYEKSILRKTFFERKFYQLNKPSPADINLEYCQGHCKVLGSCQQIVNSDCCSSV